MPSKWPPDYKLIFMQRIRVAQDVANDPKKQAILKEIYKHDPIKFINDWCVTYDPRNRPPKPKVMPFLLFGRQVEFINFLLSCYRDKENGLCEKARDIGATWLCCAFSVWLWLFHPESAIGWGSRKEEYVDKKGDPKAVFPKIRQILQYLPKWLMPVGYLSREHATYMKIINPENGSVITGEAGDNIGRGGRTSIFFKDESAHYEHPELIEAALGDNTDVQIDISSVNGTGNVFYRKRQAGVVWHPDEEPEDNKTRVFVFDWRDHPAKTQSWYDKRRSRAEEEGLLHVFKQEVDRDYSGAVDRVIIPQEWVQAAVDAHVKLGIEFTGAKYAMQDVADGGGDKNAFVARHGVICNYAKHWGGEAGQAAEIAVPLCSEMGIKELYYDSIGVGVGFKTQINTMKTRDNWPKGLRVHPWDAGASPIDPDKPSIPNDRESPTNKDQYANLKAQSWFRVRARFYKTYRAITYGEIYPHDELISISSKMGNLHELCRELSQATIKDNGEGKTLVDKKPSGTISPNLADAFIACYNPARTISVLDVI